MSRMWPLRNTFVPNTLHSHPVSPYYYKRFLILSFSILPCSPQFILHTAARTMLWKTCHIMSLLCSTHKIALYLIRTNSKPLALVYKGLQDLVPSTSISCLYHCPFTPVYYIHTCLLAVSWRHQACSFNRNFAIQISSARIYFLPIERWSCSLIFDGILFKRTFQRGLPSHLHKKASHLHLHLLSNLLPGYVFLHSIYHH